MTFVYFKNKVNCSSVNMSEVAYNLIPVNCFNNSNNNHFYYHQKQQSTSVLATGKLCALCVYWKFSSLDRISSFNLIFSILDQNHPRDSSSLLWVSNLLSSSSIRRIKHRGHWCGRWRVPNPPSTFTTTTTTSTSTVKIIICPFCRSLTHDGPLCFSLFSYASSPLSVSASLTA